MEEDEDRPPFWLQSTNHRNNHRGRSQISSILLNSSIFLIILLTIALAFLFVLIPTFIDFTSHIFRPNSIKKSWDSLNLLLVLFAIICGFLSRNINHNNEHNHNNAQQRGDSLKSYPSTPRRWSDYNQSNRLSRLRSFRSYPDLRQESFWEEPKFYDDTHIRKYYPLPDPDPVRRDLDPYRPRQQDHDQDQEEEQHHNVQELKQQVEDRIETKDIAVDTPVTNHTEVKAPPPPSQPPWAAETQKIVKRTHQHLGYERKSERKGDQVHDFHTESSPPPPPPPPPPRKVEKRRVKRSYKDAGNERKSEWKEVQVKNFYTLPPPSPPPPPPPPPPSFVEHGKRTGKDIFNSIRGKKKKQRQKSVENLETFFDPPPSTSPSLLPPPSPPPPPPPPPPPHFFQNLFSSKKGKTKKPTLPIRRANPSPPPPTQKHEAPVEESRPSNVVESGGASPFRAIPPPPPPPPFKIPAWKFVIDGDYVRVASFNSSRSGSPDLESLDEFSSDKDSPVAAPVTATVFCPSPDVDTKADNFIARMRAGLTLEKINSVKGRSNLGPGPSNFDGQGPS